MDIVIDDKMDIVLESNDPLLDTFRAATYELMAGNINDGRELLRRLSFEISSPTRRRQLSIQDEADIFDRDRYQCRYCSRKLILPAVLRLVSHLCPDEFPYHMQGKATEIHPLAAVWRAEIDHVVPVSRGGDPYGGNNLVTACTACNRRKGSQLLEEIPEMTLRNAPLDRNWAGLSEYLDVMWQKAGDHPVIPLNIDLEVTNWRREIKARRPVFFGPGGDPYAQSPHSCYERSRPRKGSTRF
jgi:5-methylcytosine-specific restriction endonuclease McrA